MRTLVNHSEKALHQGDLDAHIATWGDEIAFRSPCGGFLESDQS